MKPAHYANGALPAAGDVPAVITRPRGPGLGPTVEDPPPVFQAFHDGDRTRPRHGATHPGKERPAHLRPVIE
ncbi:hypothetical protein [Streptosporangium sp. NPDC003464]